MNFEKPMTVDELRRCELTRYLLDEPAPQVVGKLLATIAERDATIERLTKLLLDAQGTLEEGMAFIAGPGWRATADGFVRSDFAAREDGYDQGARVTFDPASVRPWKVLYRRGVPQGTTEDGPAFTISNESYASAIEAMRETDLRYPMSETPPQAV